MLKGEFYAQRLQKLIYMHLFTDCLGRLGNLPVERTKDGVCFLQRGGVSLSSKGAAMATGTLGLHSYD